MKIRDVLTREPEVIKPDATICEAARKMKELDIGMLPVCDGDRLVGSVTDRDITVRGVAQGNDPLKTTVAEVLTPKIIYCFEDSELQEAVQIMEKGQVRRLPVLNSQKRLVGIVSIGDIARRSHDEHLVEEVLERVCQPA